MSNEALDVAGLAKYLRRDARDLVKLADRGRLPGRKVGGEWRFVPVEINHWIETQLPNLSEQELRNLDEERPTPEEDVTEPLLTNLLNAASIGIPLPASTRSSVLRELVKLTEESWQVYDPEALLDAVQKREEIGSTAQEGGFALPHPGRPLPNILGESLVALGVTSTGIPFGAPDRSETDVFFLICCRSASLHLRVLARIARLVRQADFLTHLRRASDAAAVKGIIETAERSLLPLPAN